MCNKVTIPAMRPTVVQNADKSVFIENHDGGTVNINYNQPKINTTAEMLMAIRSFSTNYYQLIVTGQDIFTSNSIIVPSNRALTESIVPFELLQTHSVLTDDAIERIRTMPAIICNENTQYNGETDMKQNAIYSYIKEIKKRGKEIDISFQPIDFFPQHKLNRYAVDFEINISCALTDLNKPRWYIKKINLFDAFRAAHINVPNL